MKVSAAGKSVHKRDDPQRTNAMGRERPTPAAGYFERDDWQDSADQRLTDQLHEPVEKQP